MRGGVDFKPFACNDVNTHTSISKKKIFKSVFKSLLPLFCRPEASDKTEKAKMSKLLSYTYDKEWHDEVRKWEYKQDRLREKHKQMIAAQGPQNQEPLVSEYNTTIGKSRPPAYQPQ